MVQKANNRMKTIYWITTGLLCLQMASTGIGDLVLADQIVENTLHVGFPVSLIPFNGAMKLLGTVVILFVGNIHLKIGAYAGMLFYGSGAFYAHIAIGDPIAASIPAFMMVAFTLASYFLWKKLFFPVQLTKY